MEYPPIKNIEIYNFVTLTFLPIYANSFFLKFLISFFGKFGGMLFILIFVLFQFVCVEMCVQLKINAKYVKCLLSLLSPDSTLLST